MDKVEAKRIVEVVVGFDVNEEKIDYIKSDFMDETLGFKDPIEYTAKLLQMGLEKWVRDNIGLLCPNCDAEIQENWRYCPECGWTNEEE